MVEQIALAQVRGGLRDELSTKVLFSSPGELRHSPLFNLPLHLRVPGRRSVDCHLQTVSLGGIGRILEGGAESQIMGGGLSTVDVL